MNALQELQRWYHSQCDGEWEHSYGIEIGTLDNPGWKVVINLTGTDLENLPYVGTAEELPVSELDWIHCSVKDGKWHGYGGPFMLDEILRAFLIWAVDRQTSNES